MKRRRFFIVLLTVVCVYLIYQACTKPKSVAPVQPQRNANVWQSITDSVTNIVTGGTGGNTGGTGSNGLQAPTDFLIAVSKAYALNTGDYFQELGQLSGGENKFWFYGKSNGNPYPTGDWITTLNGYTSISIATHALNWRAGHGSNPNNSQWNNARPKIEVKIKDQSGNIVFYLYDTKSGFHPSFIPSGRGNNHPKQCERYLNIQSYIVEIKNISDDTLDMPITATFGRTATQNNEFWEVVINKGETVTRNLDLFASDSMFKLNYILQPL